MARGIGALLVAALCSGLGCASNATRETEDRRDPLRRCETVPSTASDPLEASVACAEWFVRTQGYTAAPAHADLALVVPEGIEYGLGKAGWLERRRNTLTSRAAGVCYRPSNPEVIVAFAAVPPDSGLRAVTLFLDGSGLRVQHSRLLPEVFESADYGCRLRTMARTDGAT